MESPLPTAPAARRRWRWLWTALAAVPVGLIGTSWWLTEPLEPATSASTTPDVVRAAVPAEPVPKAKADPLEWPKDRLEGRAAKELLLATLLDVQARLERVEGYTAVLRRRERLRGKLGEEQTLEMKARHRPFSIYLKFLNPEAGKEVVYSEDKYDGHVMAHPAGMARLLVPRLKVPPTHPLALADNRHPITEAGLLNLVRKLVGFREMDLIDAHAVTVLDRTIDHDGRPWLRALHTHPHHKIDRPFARVEVLFDPTTKFPLRITSHDWPGPGHVGDLNLAEQYAYDDLVLDPELSDSDFDPANPAYNFTRFK